MTTITIPPQYSFLSPIHQEPFIPRRMTEWVEYLERRTSNERRIEVLKGMPKIYVSPDDFYQTLWSVRVQGIFKHFNVREMKELLAWMWEEILTLPQVEEEEAAIKNAHVTILFDVLQGALKGKRLDEDFSVLEKYASVRQYLA